MASSAPSSSLTRNQLVVSAITVFAAAYGASLIYRSYTSHSSESVGAGIRRSPAFRRPRHVAPEYRPQPGLDPPITEPFPPTTQDGETPDFAMFRTSSYGRWEHHNGDNPPVFINLQPENLPTLQSLQHDFGMAEEPAQVLLEALQQEFVTRFAMVHINGRARRAGDPIWWAAAARFLQETGIPIRAVERALEEFRQTLQDPENDEGAPALEALEGVQARGDDLDTISGTEVADYFPRQQGGGMNLKQLLYNVAESQARQEVLHRGFRCDACNTTPIRGIRWKCSNCADIDHCNDCHAQSTHTRSHIFYEIRIPTHTLSNITPVQELSYPGRPHHMPHTLPSDICKRLVEQTGFEKAEIEGLYEQYSCIANTPMLHEPGKINRGIDRDTFQKAIMPIAKSEPLRPNLIFDRIFFLFDFDRDNLIGFDDFVMGVLFIRTKSKGKARLRRIFDAYDVDGDGYVSRRDFLRMFRAFFVLQKDLFQDMLSPNDIKNGLRDAAKVVYSSQPLSSAFTEDRIPAGMSITPRNKKPDEYGEMRHQPQQQVVKADSPNRVKRREIVGNAWESQAQFPFDHKTGEPLSVRDFLFLASRDKHQQPNHSLARDQRVHFTYGGQSVETGRRAAWRERWRRRRFYTDEEEGYTTAWRWLRVRPTVEVEVITESVGGPSTPLSASTSKPQSSRDVGGYLIPQAEYDLAQDVTYQVMEDAMNELLDPLFQTKEDPAFDITITKKEREQWKSEIEAYQKKVLERAQEAENMAKDPLLATAAAAEEAAKAEPRFPKPAVPSEPSGATSIAEVIASVEEQVAEQSLGALLDDTGYAIGGDDVTDQADNSTELAVQQQEHIRHELSFTDNGMGVSDSVGASGNGHTTGWPAESAGLTTTVVVADLSGTDVVNATIHHDRSMFVRSPPSARSEEHEVLVSQQLNGDSSHDRDNTMPQFRPNSDKDLELESRASDVTVDPIQTKSHEHWDGAVSLDGDKSKFRDKFEAEIVRKFESMFLGWERNADGKVVNGTTRTTEQGAADLEKPPSEERLAELAKLQEMDAEFRERKGPGKLSFEEFDRFLDGVKGNDFAFLENFLELVYF